MSDYFLGSGGESVTVKLVGLSNGTNKDIVKEDTLIITLANVTS